MLNGKLEMKPNVHRIIYEFRLAKVSMEVESDTTKNCPFVIMRTLFRYCWEAEARRRNARTVHHHGGKYLVSHVYFMPRMCVSVLIVCMHEYVLPAKPAYSRSMCKREKIYASA